MAHHTEIVPTDHQFPVLIDQPPPREATKHERKEGLDVESCISALEKKKDEALKCYDDNLDIDVVCKFLEMLLLDGCFVWSLFESVVKSRKENMATKSSTCNG
ncbi:hypothetical protein FXO38_34767 [Capsicum annuum]|nr:hypothetical protein FXO38_34767 [Capsicum annuum]